MLLVCLSIHFHSTSINKKCFGCPILCQTSWYHHFHGLLIFLMEKILVWYLVFLSFKINSVVLNVCRCFKRKIFFILISKFSTSFGLRSKHSAKFPDFIVLRSLVSLFIWGVFILFNWLIFLLFTNLLNKILLIPIFLSILRGLMYSREIFLWTNQFLC